MAKRTVKKKSASTLLGKDEILKNVSDATNQPIEEKIKDIQIGRPIDANKALRKKYTTMVNPMLSTALKMEAAFQQKSAADLLEEILYIHLDKRIDKIKGEY